jgi:hypothetical protein
LTLSLLCGGANYNVYLIGTYTNLRCDDLPAPRLFCLCRFKIAFERPKLMFCFQAYQGQFSMPLAFQGISVYLWQTVGRFQAFLLFI